MYEISSDSDEEWYDKCPKKLEKLRNKHGIQNVIKIDSEEQIKVNDDSLLNCLNSDVIEVFDDGSTKIIPNDFDSPTKAVSQTRRSKRKNGDIQSFLESLPEIGAKRGRPRGRGNKSPATPKQRGRGRGSQSKTRGRRKNSTSSLEDPDYDSPVNILLPSPRRPGRGRKRGGRQTRSNLPPMIPTYSVGNTYEYPDASDEQVLFSQKQVIPEPVQVIDLDESLENEELSVKVLWQHSDVVKFNIRRHQKLTQIFDFFVNEKGVSRDRLLFTYNYGTRDRVLKPDDTPDSIEYNIAKFIEGGVVNRQISLVKKDSPQKKGFIIKFQIQNKKKPLELSVGKDDKLQLAMVKCAEHFELPISNLVFEFDGEMIPGTTSPSALDMESGDCIDVKIKNVNK